MKYIAKICGVCIIALSLFACKEHVPSVEQLPTESIDFTYKVINDTVYNLDYYVGATIQFYPTVKLGAEDGDITWNFGDGTATAVGDTVTHVFEAAGTYFVKATTTKGDSKSNVLYISDIRPIVTLIQEDSICVVDSSYISFHIELPNPSNLPAIYQWTFPEGTTNEAGKPVATFTGTYEQLGKVKFAKVGSQTVTIQVLLNERPLEAVKKNVQVALNVEAPTLYYAVKGGNIMAIKIPETPVEGVTIEPYDMGVSAGQHALNILFHEGLLYILDAGKQFNYVNDENGVMGDGQITIMSKDASGIEAMISNVGGPAFQDPFFGFIENGNLYYSDRNTGMITVPLNTRNETYSAAKFPYFVQNNYLGYYGAGGLAYGAITGCFGKVKDTYYWSKTYNGNGLYRFKFEDILSAPVTDKDPIPASGAVLTNAFSPKAFIYDENNDDFFFTLYGTGEGFYKCKVEDLPSMKDSKTLKELITFEDGNGCPQITTAGMDEGSSGEFLGITQLALDKETGNVYFGLRSGDSKVKSGLVMYNRATNKLQYLIEDIQVYGVSINQVPSQLF